MLPDDDFTLGVEEEYLLVDPDSRELVPARRAVLAHSQPALGELAIQHELYPAQVEIGTPGVPDIGRAAGQPDRPVAPAGRRGASQRLPDRRRRLTPDAGPGRAPPAQAP
jgi:hypothetical protein